MKYVYLLLITLLLAFACSQNIPGSLAEQNSSGGQNNQPVMPSRWYFAEFLSQLDSLSDPQAQTALTDSFMNYAAQFGFPLTEDTLAHFLYRGNPAFPFSVAGDFNGWQPNRDNFSRAAQTNLYYVSKTFPRDARLDYKFVLNNNWILDPLNPHTVTGGFGPNSELAMPDYIQPWEINYDPSIPHGQVVLHTFHSSILNNNRTVRVYLPPGYQQDTLSYPSLYVQDGGEYVQLASMVNVLDNLLAANQIRPIISVFVDPVNRNQEYWLNDNYVAMLVNELIPFIDSQYRCKPQPQHRGMMGASLGGVISLYAAFQHPEVFGIVGGQSSAIQINNNAIIQLYDNAPRKDIRLYLDWGTFESLQQLHHQFIPVLQSKGYPLTYNEYHEGHSWGNWRAHIDELLTAFWEVEVTGIKPVGR